MTILQILWLTLGLLILLVASTGVGVLMGIYLMLKDARDSGEINVYESRDRF